MDGSLTDLIIQSRVVIARFGERDLFQWWDDNALTVSGQFVMDKLFPRTAVHSRAEVAIEAATIRHHTYVPTNARLTLFRLPSNIKANIRVRMLELKRSGAGKSIERLLAPIDSKATVSDVLLKANLVGKADLDAAKIESESGLTISLGRVNECDLENTGVVEQLVRHDVRGILCFIQRSSGRAGYRSGDPHFVTSARKRHYTSNLMKGGALITESRRLLHEWRPDDSLESFRDRIVAENALGKVTRARVQDIINRVYIRRFLTADVPSIDVLQPLLESSLGPEVTNKVLLYHAALAEDLLYDFVTEHLFSLHDAGRYRLNTSDALVFIDYLTRQGLISPPLVGQYQAKDG